MFVCLFFLLLLIQCLLEGSIYTVFLAIKNNRDLEDFMGLLESIARYSGYRFGVTVIPYLFLTFLFSKLISKNSMFYIGILNLIVNAIIIGFIGFYLESLLFNEEIFYTTLIVGIILLIYVILLKPKFMHKIIQSQQRSN